MICRPEQVLLLFSALPEHNDYIITRTDDILRTGVDWNFLLHTAESLGVAAGLINLLSGRNISEDGFFYHLKVITEREMKESESMQRLFLELSSLLSKRGFDFMPLKGCDPRIAGGSRRVCNSMVDIDILVREADTDDIGMTLEESGYLYHGDLSGTHMNFFTDEEQPQFIEIHWDLINRRNPLHSKLFTPELAGIWERSIVMNGIRILSEEDLLSYLTAHAVKEYFHKPKWLSDIAWIIENRLEYVDPGKMVLVVEEWGVAKVLGIVAEGLDYYFHTDNLKKALVYSAMKPGILGSYIAKRLICYNRLRTLRPLIFAASAGTSRRLWGVMTGALLRLLQKFKLIMK